MQFFVEKAFLSLLEGIYLLENLQNGCHREGFLLMDYNRLSMGHILMPVKDRIAWVIYSWEIVYLQAKKASREGAFYKSIQTFIWKRSFYYLKL